MEPQTHRCAFHRMWELRSVVFSPAAKPSLSQQRCPVLRASISHTFQEGVGTSPRMHDPQSQRLSRMMPCIRRVASGSPGCWRLEDPLTGSQWRQVVPKEPQTLHFFRKSCFKSGNWMSFKPSEGPRFWSSEGEAAGSQGLGGHLHCNEWSPKLGLCLLLLNRNMETEFWVKENTALLFCLAKGTTAGQCLKDCALLGRD